MDVHFRCFYTHSCLMNAASFIFPFGLQLTSPENVAFSVHCTIAVSQRKVFKLNKCSIR
uniref:ZP domain-containing protein n=1 Tax=Parascaris univalens TaxID=6257 RepID=A0A914ZSW7_PARUN